MAKNNPGEPYTRISTEEAFNKVNSEKDSVVVDVRREDEYLSGHVKNSIWIPVDEYSIDTMNYPQKAIYYLYVRLVLDLVLRQNMPLQWVQIMIGYLILKMVLAPGPRMVSQYLKVKKNRLLCQY